MECRVWCPDLFQRKSRVSDRVAATVVFTRFWGAKIHAPKTVTLRLCDRAPSLLLLEGAALLGSGGGGTTMTI